MKVPPLSVLNRRLDANTSAIFLLALTIVSSTLYLSAQQAIIAIEESEDLYTETGTSLGFAQQV